MVRGHHNIVLLSTLQYYSRYQCWYMYTIAEAVVGESVVVIKKLLQLHVSYMLCTYVPSACIDKCVSIFALIHVYMYITFLKPLKKIG